MLSILVVHAAQDSWKVTPYETREHVPGVDSLNFHREAVRHNAEACLISESQGHNAWLQTLYSIAANAPRILINRIKELGSHAFCPVSQAIRM